MATIAVISASIKITTTATPIIAPILVVGEDGISAEQSYIVLTSWSSIDSPYIVRGGSRI